MWPKYPYMNMNDLNLDWIINMIKSLQKEMDTYTALNTISWAGTWNIGEAYKQWTIVEDGGDGYLSIQPVPRNVPINDTDYWVLVADFSALYAAFAQRITDLENTVDNIDNTEIPGLQNQIDSLQSQVDLLANRQFVVVADSYGQHNNSDGRNFYVQAFYELGITDYYDFKRGGAGFCRTDNTNFLNVLTDYESAIPDKSEITDIIVVGGANDQVDPSNIENGISAFMAYVKTNYPNAKVYVTHFSNTISPTYSAYLKQSIDYYIKYCGKYGAGYVANSEWVMAKLSHFQSDNVHPSETGIRAMTKYFEQFLLTGVIDVYETAENCFAAYDSSIQLQADSIKFAQHNGMVTVYGTQAGAGLEFQYPGSKSYSAGHVAEYDMFEITDGYFYSCTQRAPAFQVFMGLGSTRFWHGILFCKNIGSNLTSLVGLINYLESAAVGYTFNLTIGVTTFALFE